jgi:hypothetical protein
MRSKDEARAIFAGLAIAYLAKAGMLERPSVLMFRERVLMMLQGQGDVWDCVEHFCAAYDHCHMIPDAVADLGNRLRDRLAALTRPDPPGSDRKDTHG